MNPTQPELPSHRLTSRRRRVAFACGLGLLTLTASIQPASPAAATPSAAAVRFTLSSPDPKLSAMPEAYTAKLFGCTGGNASPPLTWTGAPDGTLSYVVTLFDRDEHSTPSGWWHWIVYDIPKSTTSLATGAGAAHGPILAAPAKQGRTDLGENAYHGPCPAKGDAPHRYVFTVYALNVATLDVPADSSGAMITSTAAEHVLAKAVLTVHHGR
jgi:Raf kinase inhibitor-like YbhB/YbcL family protein